MPEPTLRGDRPHRDGATARRRVGRVAMALTTSLLVLGPWPVADPGSEWARPMGRALGRIGHSAGSGPPAPIRVGMAEVDLTPDAPRPPAGFIGQVRTPYAGVDGPCVARALTVESPLGKVTILTADLLLINRKLASEVARRAGVRPDEIYVTASHTHSGPGGWGDHPLERLVAGDYDRAFFDRLAGRLAEAVGRSRASTEPAELAIVQAFPKGRQSNRIEPASTTHDALSALVFRPVDAPEGAPPLAILAIFGAHATVSHPVPPRLGGDYPSALVSELEKRTHARMVLFASGAVGDASPARPKARTTWESAEALGRLLADDLLAALPSARFEREIPVGNLRVAVDLPPVRLPFFSPGWRFGPALTWWIADRSTHLHALRLGPAVLVGFPGDYSGHLADRLVESARGSGLTPVATSFDGDYRGYLVSEAVWRRRPSYETRWMSFHGAATGDRLSDLAGVMVERLASPRMGEDSMSRTYTLGMLWSIEQDGEAVFRAATWLLLSASTIVLAFRWPEALAVARRSGFVAAGLAISAAFALAIDPDRCSWMQFGLPLPARAVGLPLALIALIGAWWIGFGRAALLLAAAVALLSANWVVVLMGLRGWARASFVGGPADRDSPKFISNRFDLKSVQKS